MGSIIILYYNIILWDHRRICCPLLAETSFAAHDCIHVVNICDPRIHVPSYLHYLIKLQYTARINYKINYKLITKLSPHPLHKRAGWVWHHVLLKFVRPQIESRRHEAAWCFRTRPASSEWAHPTL